MKRFQSALPVVVMTAFGSVETAVDAMKAGASDYVLKPFSLDEMRMVVHKELDVHRLRAENRSLREALQQRYQHPNVVGRSAEDAGSAGNGGAGGSDEFHRPAGRGKRRGQGSGGARHP